jgi:hypothetical protein
MASVSGFAWIKGGNAMQFFVLCLMSYLTFALGQVNLAPGAAHQVKLPGDAVADQLAGAWRLVSVETMRPSGEVIYPFYGKHPEGLLVYERGGWMSVQMVSDPQPTVPATDSRQAFLAAPASEKVTAIDSYYAYYGTWNVDPSGGSVTHHIRQSLYPGERGEEVVRRLSIQGNRLTLLAKAHEMGEDHERRFLWERLPPSPVR